MMKRTRLQFVRLFIPCHVDKPGKECIYAHIDMDCYFVQIALLHHPELKNQPVAVSSSDSSHPARILTHSPHSEISSCNYEARRFGVRKGDWMQRAKEACPNLVVLPYDFDLTKEVSISVLPHNQTSKQIVHIVLEYTPLVQIGSCDELFCDLSAYSDRQAFLSILHTIKCLSFPSIPPRRRIGDETHCSCSIGVSHNLLMCRIATKEWWLERRVSVEPSPTDSCTSPSRRWRRICATRR